MNRKQMKRLAIDAPLVRSCSELLIYFIQLHVPLQILSIIQRWIRCVLSGRHNGVVGVNKFDVCQQKKTSSSGRLACGCVNHRNLSKFSLLQSAFEQPPHVSWL